MLLCNFFQKYNHHLTSTHFYSFFQQSLLWINVFSARKKEGIQRKDTNWPDPILSQTELATSH